MNIKVPKTLIIAIFLLLTFTGFAPKAIAQETQENSDFDLTEENMPAEIQDVAGLRAELVQKTQDPVTKVVEFDLILTSNVDSDRTKVTWNLYGTSIFADAEQVTQSFSIQKGNTYSIPIEVIPTTEGVSELVGKVESFDLGESFTLSVRKNYASNYEGEILPITDEYKSKKLQSTLLNYAKYTAILLFIGIAGLFGLRFFLKWYDKDDRKEFENRKK